MNEGIQKGRKEDVKRTITIINGGERGVRIVSKTHNKYNLLSFFFFLYSLSLSLYVYVCVCMCVCLLIGGGGVSITSALD